MTAAKHLAACGKAGWVYCYVISMTVCYSSFDVTLEHNPVNVPHAQPVCCMVVLQELTKAINQNNESNAAGLAAQAGGKMSVVR